MNKSELIVALAQKAELSKKDAEKALGAFVEVVTETLKAGDKVQLVGFGTFESKVRPARTARNPRTGGMYAGRTKNFCKERRRLKEIFLPCGFSAREAEGREEKPRRGTRGG